MPIRRGKDSFGCYYQFRSHGKKYYYQSNDTLSCEIAKNKALKQGRAIEWSRTHHQR